MKILKSNKGISMADLTIALLILIMFSGIIGNMIYKIAYNNACIRVNEVAAEYAIKIAEYTDKISYDEVTALNLVDKVKENYNIPDTFNIEIEVNNYTELEGNETKGDIIKIVNIKVNYSILNDKKTYEIKKLKIKEI